MEALDYIVDRAKSDGQTHKDIQALEKVQSEQQQQIDDQSDTLDVLMTEVIPYD